MRKEYVFISLMALIVVIKMFMPSSEQEVISSGGSVSSEQSTGSEVDNMVDENNKDMLDLDNATMESLTVDEATGESCNEYIPELIETGSASYTISPENTIFDYFCSQTVGGDDYSQLDLSGYDEPALIVGYFENTSMNNGTEYVGLSEMTDDLYLACHLDTMPVTLNAVDTKGWWDQINCDISTLDSHVFFQPEKVLDPATNQYVLTDYEMENGTFTEYKEELGKIQTWYSDNGYFKVDEFLNNFPTEEDLNLQYIDYDVVKNSLEALQAEVKENYKG